jgi:uncharacterized lipoprotein YajG
MTKAFVPCFPLLLLAACAGEPASAPSPDPQKLELLLASLESAPAAVPAADEGFKEKLAEADRLSGAVAKVQPDKVDPKIVAGLIAK